LDYCFICFFLGNDFLPHLPGVDIRTNGMEIVMKSYKNIMKNYRTKYLVGDDKITIPLFQEYIQELQSVSDKIRKNITSMQRNMIDDKDTWTKDEIDKRMFTWSIENIGEKLYENKKINQLLKLNEQTYEDVLKYYITGSYISSTSIAASSSSS
jgi:5'-3' exoribonuclease 2